MASQYTVLFFICCFSLSLSYKNEEFISSVEQKIETKFGEYSNYLASWFKSINDKHLVQSDVGRMLHYEELEPRVEKAANVEGRNMKKITSMLPLIFHLGMTSAWMLLTTLLAAKSVAIGLTLLTLKIAVGSAKLASYFSTWKHNKHTHYEYVPYHGHKRSVRSIADTHYSQPEYYHHETPTYYSYQEASPSVSPYYSHEAASPYYAQAYGEYEYQTAASEKKAQEKKYQEKKYG